MNEFRELNINEAIIEALEKIDITTPTPIQRESIPYLLQGLDCIGQAQTGTGKTFAYSIPLIEKIDSSSKNVQSLVLCPTRELSLQVSKEIDKLAANIKKIRVATIYGGESYEKQFKALKQNPQIIIGTPGRIIDQMNRGNISFANVKYLVLDEADMVLESGFLDEVGFILSKMKKHVQLMVFSATIPEQLQQFLRKYMKNPISIDADKTNITSKSVTHIAYPTRNRDKLEVLKYLCESINPYLCLIFASRKEDVDKIYRYLKSNEFDVGVIHGDLDSTTRKTMMKRIRNDEFRYIVASDIAARGIDIEGVTHVINYNLPYEEDFYFHRAGRTGRNNADGICFTLYDKEEVKYVLRFINKGVKFINREYKNGKWVDLKPLVKQMTPKKKDSEVQKKINKTININKNQKVKPGYKKKLNKEIEKIKQKHRREVIKKDIERQKKARYIAQSKAMKGE